MPKYVIIVLIVVIGTFIIMNYWPKLKETTKNKIIASIFGYYKYRIHGSYFTLNILV